GGAGELGGEDVWIAPGFIDLQLNGYGGHDFNQRFWTEGESPTDTITQIVELAARSGTPMLCPTICTNSREAILSGLREIARVCGAHLGDPGSDTSVRLRGSTHVHPPGQRGACADRAASELHLGAACLRRSVRQHHQRWASSARLGRQMLCPRQRSGAALPGQ